MKKILIIALATIFLAGCTENTQYGSCIGIADDKDPALIYKVNVWNVILGIVFVETVIVPVIVLADQTLCPIGKK